MFAEFELAVAIALEILLTPVIALAIPATVVTSVALGISLTKV